jgi:ketosteroid isomerase-like protein
MQDLRQTAGGERSAPDAASPAHAATDDDTVLRALNESYIRAVRVSDVAWFDRHLSDDFVNSNPDGSLVDRAAFLRQVAVPLAVGNFGVEDVRVTVFGNAAIVHGRTTYTRPDGSAAAGRYTDVWERAGSSWTCKAAHVTRG